jgi:hypothetical protein
MPVSSGFPATLVGPDLALSDWLGSGAILTVVDRRHLADGRLSKPSSW